LTGFEPCSTSRGAGLEHFAREGFMKRLVTSHLGVDSNPGHVRLALDNKMEVYPIPLGTASQLLLEIARKSPGLLTKVGLYSYLDPRVQSVKYNEITAGDLIKAVEFEGEEWLLYKTFPINVAIIRGTVADEDGNLSLEEEALTQNVLYQAMAARNWGGKVIAQVKRVVPAGSIDPRMVLVPGVMVDAIVIAKEQWQHERFPGEYDPGLDGRKRVPPPPAPLFPFNMEKVIARRTAMELEVGKVVNWGGGIPTRRVAALTLEEDIQDLFFVSREHGTLGGVSYGRDCHINPTSWLNYQDLFNWYTGGGLDIGLLGFGQIDEEGNVNLSRFSREVLRGPGGAADIAYLARKMVFAGSFTEGKLQVDVDTGKNSIAIVNEGRNIKFVKRVYQVTASGRYLKEQGKPVLIVTERAVFRLTRAGLELIEIAPGIDVEKDILAKMEYKPLVASPLRQMDRRIFSEGLVGLRRDMLGHEEKGRQRAVPMMPSDKLPMRSYWTARPPKM
ncbi:MAG: acyl CoA:acetate/3-ketoacid CoA transferase, partial [Chloroflexi bacterium]|nr:acyl CoA:acetate/3-ketoacid CoA transferase [Chloroflexota bacterium]